MAGTLDLFFEVEVDWLTALLALQRLQKQYNCEEIYIREIQGLEAGNLLMRLFVPAQLDADLFTESFWRKYKSILALRRKAEPQISEQSQLLLQSLEPERTQAQTVSQPERF